MRRSLPRVARCYLCDKRAEYRSGERAGELLVAHGRDGGGRTLGRQEGDRPVRHVVGQGRGQAGGHLRYRGMHDVRGCDQGR
ncbi:hypothetical protein Psi02_55650 [Planotetraspora silvatica]|uniref:Uncharacterized protein n=1 Tax=Planotetraspora silvatica TaxID=234614 RepID=A0A8J3UTE0_9ACTN|nr:hypothetical protein Psi02_55650 [Planotetraspora silvatica]